MSASSPLRTSPAHLATVLADGRNDLITRHRRERKGLSVVLALSGLHDRVIADCCSGAGMGPQRLAVVALGGYGRRELCFESDVDLMILAPDDDSKEAGAGVMRKLLHILLDIGLDVGHSFRSVDDCVALRSGPADVWLSLLDARFIAGDRGTFGTFITRMRETIRTGAAAVFVRELLALHDARHARYGMSSKLLEPNVKNSAGGLRDIQTVAWLLKGTGLERLGVPSRRSTLESVLASRSLQRVFPPSFLPQAVRAMDVLLLARNEMHLQAGALHDTLEFTTQTPIARALGYRNGRSASCVERFMRDYFDAASTVAALAERTALWARERWLQPSATAGTRVISDRLRLRSNKVDLTSPTTRLDSAMILTAFHERAELGAGFSFALEDSIHRRRERLGALRSADEAELFLRLMRRPRGAADALRLMNRLGLLARWIPEWRPLVRFFQHNQYHFYTADEHTLNVVANAEALLDEDSSFGEATRSLPRWDVLVFACLLHDIAKPIRIEDHEVAGVGVAERVLERLRAGEIVEDVSFLVRHHLTMEQVAFRRNLSDQTTVREFASRFPRPELLDYLYVLTRADLSAVNTNVWTEWKSSLLTELYRKARAVLRPDLPATPVRPGPEVLEAKLLRSHDATVVGAHRSLLDDESYRAAFSADEVSEHLRAISGLGVIDALFQQWTDSTEATLLTRDAPFVLSRCCGVLSANDANIIDARVFTRADGVVIDKFRLVDAVAGGALSQERCRKLRDELGEVFAGRTDLDHLLERHRRRWKRRATRHNPNIRIDVEFEDHPVYTIIDVFASDTLGFLYRVTETFSRIGLSIHFAKISTRGDGIVDSFYVLDHQGERLTRPERRAEVREAVLGVIRDLAASRLELM